MSPQANPPPVTEVIYSALPPLNQHPPLSPLSFEEPSETLEWRREYFDVGIEIDKGGGLKRCDSNDERGSGEKLPRGEYGELGVLSEPAGREDVVLVVIDRS